MKATPFQVAALVNPPAYPNSIIWSEDNLIAVATADIVTILNPDKPHAPRGVVTLTPALPFPVGVIDKADLLSGCLLPTCLSRDRQPCVRSLSWSPAGLAPNYGCLLAVCSTEGHVKVYRQPYCEFQAEWIEVVDISDLMHGYFAKINYGEPNGSSVAMDSATEVQVENSPAAFDKTNFNSKRAKTNRVLNFNPGALSCEQSDAADTDEVYAVSETGIVPTYSVQEGALVEVLDVDYERQIPDAGRCKTKENNSCGKKAGGKDRRNNSKKTSHNSSQPLISARQYASRYSLLASLVVAWSPMLQVSATAADNICDCYSLLAVGTKGGTVSIWRFHRPAVYTIEHPEYPITGIHVGVLAAHKTWVTALSWGFLPSDSGPQVLLASGCSDGSVKIWVGDGHELQKSREATPFSLLSEVTAGDNVLVSALSLCVPVQSPRKILLAVGKGSGSMDLWTCNIKTMSLKKVGSYHAHVHVITGLAWAFDGRCIYSSSLDNSIHVWVHHKGSLSAVSMPPNNLGSRSSSDLPSVSDSCYGVAVSPGNLAVAVARRFDAEQLDNMYQKRTQRAAVEFFWIGGQEVNVPSTVNIEFDVEACSVISKEELRCWVSKIMWSLNQYESHNKHLVLWDIIAASLALKQYTPGVIEQLIRRWLEHLLKGQLDPLSGDILSVAPNFMKNITSRKLHLLNIICRLVIVSSGFKGAEVCAKPESESLGVGREWVKLVLNCEKQLRQRLVGFCLSAVLSHMSHPPSNSREFRLWSPAGMLQMLKWVTQNHDNLHHPLNLLASKAEKLAPRLNTVYDCIEEEHCTFCSAEVIFDCPETAVCQGVKCTGEAAQKHNLTRCSVSMEVCPLAPLWFCVCCQRRASRLPPQQLFTLPNYPTDFMLFINTQINTLLSKPLCPFCGISLHRQQPDFFLSPSPV